MQKLINSSKMATASIEENPLNIFRNLDIIKAERVEEFRRLVYEYATAHPDEIDLVDVRSRIRPPDENEDNYPKAAIPDWMLKRLLVSAKVPLKLEFAMAKFVDVFKFRAHWKLSTLTARNTLPVEFYKIVPFIADGEDRDGNRLMIIRIRYYKKLPQFEVIIKRAMVYIVEQIDRLYESEAPFNGVGILMDLTDFHYRNVDLDLLYFIISLAFKWPGNVRSVFIYNLPMILKMFLSVSQKMIDTLSPIKTPVNLTSIDSKSIGNYIAPDQLPDFLGGLRPVKTEVPADALPLEEILHSLEDLIEPANAKKILDYVKELMKNY